MRVLLIDVDSLRPDHLGCYGYERATSPTIDAVASEGVRFDRCYVSDSPCLPSRTALATCRFGAKTGVVTHFGPGQWYDEPGRGHGGDPDRPLAFRLLSEAGVHTATVTSFSKRHLAYHFSASFRESIQPTADTGGERGPDVTATATSWLDEHADEDDWLLHVNYWDVHHPYQGIDEHVDAVRESGAAAVPDEDVLAAQREMTGVRCGTLWPNPSRYEDYGDGSYAEWPIPREFDDPEDVEFLVDGYDAAVRTVDAEVGRLLAKLEAEGVREETAVVVTGDHGEALGEHGVYAEHAFAHPACQRVPMVVSWPDVTDGGGRAVGEQVYQFDLIPTICDLAGVEIPAGWDAEPFTPALRGDGFDGRERVVCGHGIYTFGRAVYEGDWAFVRLLHPGVFSMPGLYNDPDLPGAGLELLHDVSEDPYMTEDVAEDHPEKAAELRAALDGWVARTVATPEADAGGTDPLARMAAEEGPFLYANPESLAELYRELGRSDRAIEAVERARTWTPPRGN